MLESHALTSSALGPIDVARFWSRVNVRARGGRCWEWKGSRQPKGYGTFRLANSTLQAHRVAYALAVGNIPNGAHICHHCDNPPCCRPDHLFAGSNDDNVADAMAKGRGHLRGVALGVDPTPSERRARGERQARAKLTASQVVELRHLVAQGIPYVALAQAYGINPAAVGLIAHGRTWAHIPGALATIPYRGENNKAHKLTEREVIDIRHQYALGASLASLARKYSVSAPTVKYVVTRKTWKHIP